MPRILQRVFLIAGIIMLIDLAFFGPGLTLPFLNISLRRTLFVIILATLVFRRLLSSRSFTTDEVAFVTLLLAFGMIWGILLPSSYGYSFSQSFADISPWMPTCRGSWSAVPWAGRCGSGNTRDAGGGRAVGKGRRD